MPERLSGMDAFWLNVETPTAHMHVGSVIVLGPSRTSDEAITRDRLAAYIGLRLHKGGVLRRRLSAVPFNLGFPSWVDSGEVDLDYHVRRAALPRPGGPAELAEFAGDLMGRPLDRSRPLWELWLLEGLEGGRVALVTKTHHAAVDGVSGAELTTALLQQAPDQPAPVPEAVQPGEAPPGSLRSLLDAARGMAGMPLRAVRPGVRAAGSLSHMLLAASRAGARPEATGDADGEDGQQQVTGRVPAPLLTAPASRLNGAVGPHRRVALGALALATVEAIRREGGGTLNDVLLATVAGALRTWLPRPGEMLDRPLVALVPVSTRAPGSSTDSGNQLSAMLVPLPVHVADPMARLRAVSAATPGAKAQHGEMGAGTLQQLAELTPAPVTSLLAHAYSRLRGADRHPPLWNVVVSNVPGPRRTLYCAGLPVEAIHPLAPVHDTAALNITVLSYDGGLYVGLNADRDLVPDLAALPAALTAALDDLRSAISS